LLLPLLLFFSQIYSSFCLHFGVQAIRSLPS
jgi:hypothetical protein